MLSRIKQSARAVAEFYARVSTATPAAVRGALAVVVVVAVAFSGATITTVATAERAEAAYYVYKRCHNNGIRLRVRFLVGEGQARTVVYDTLARARYRYKAQNPDFYYRWSSGVNHKAGHDTKRVGDLWQQKARFYKNLTLAPGGTLRTTGLKRSGGGCSVTRTAPTG